MAAETVVNSADRDLRWEACERFENPLAPGLRIGGCGRKFHWYAREQRVSQHGYRLCPECAAAFFERRMR